MRGGYFSWLVGGLLCAAVSARAETVTEDGGVERSAVVFTAERLLREPRLLEAALQEALDTEQPELLAELTAVYERLPEADSVLLARAQGMNARFRGDYARAVALYEAVLRREPHNTRVRLDLAAMLAEDRQWNEAERLFEEVMRVEGLPEQVGANVQRYLDAAAYRRRWQWDGGVSPAYDGNVNNAALEHCSIIGCSKERAEGASGIAYNIQAAKLLPLAGHHNLLFEARFGGQSYYWSRKSAYDSAQGQIGLGWLWEDARQNLLVSPFYRFDLSGTDNWGVAKPQRQQTFAMDMWAHGYGVRLSYQRLLGRNWQGFVSAEAVRRHYRSTDEALRQDGWYFSQNIGVAWRPLAGHTFSGSLFFNQGRPVREYIKGIRNNTAYDRHGIQGAWTADWNVLGGLSTGVNVSVAKRRFRGTALNITPMGFFPAPRRDSERSLGVSVWHRGIRVWGMTPRFSVQWRRHDSSHVWAKRRSRQFNVEWEKRF